MQTPLRQALEQGRVQHGGYQDGRVVDLRAAAHRTLYLIGDLHARPGRIRDLFAHACLEEQLSRDQAVVVFLGDLFHREEDHRAGEMDSSIEMLHRVAELKARFPRSVYFLLGNHEFTRSASTKRGYAQGELFRRALEEHGLSREYDHFLQASPLVVVHPRCVGVHAGPALSVSTLEELKHLPIRDGEPTSMHPAVMELAFFRHVSFAPNAARTYYDHQVEDFLTLCGVPDGRLITGHTPLDRDTGWSWDLGPRTTVIFAAGRELGYFRATPEREEFVRVGRSQPGDDDRILPDRAPAHPPESPGLTLDRSRGRTRWQVEDPGAGVQLLPDVLYHFHYPAGPVTLQRQGQPVLRLCQYRHLSGASQACYAQGTYLVGREQRQEVLRLRRDLAVLLGGSELCLGVRFGWGEEELAILRMLEEGEFELRPLAEGLRLS